MKQHVRNPIVWANRKLLILAKHELQEIDTVELINMKHGERKELYENFKHLSKPIPVTPKQAEELVNTAWVWLGPYKIAGFMSREKNRAVHGENNRGVLRELYKQFVYPDLSEDHHLRPLNYPKLYGRPAPLWDVNPFNYKHVELHRRNPNDLPIVPVKKDKSEFHTGELRQLVESLAMEGDTPDSLAELIVQDGRFEYSHIKKVAHEVLLKRGLI